MIKIESENEIEIPSEFVDWYNKNKEKVEAVPLEKDILSAIKEKYPDKDPNLLVSWAVFQHLGIDFKELSDTSLEKEVANNE